MSNRDRVNAMVERLAPNPEALESWLKYGERMVHARATTSKQSNSIKRQSFASDSAVGRKVSKNRTGQAMTEVVGRAAKRLRRY